MPWDQGEGAVAGLGAAAAGTRPVTPLATPGPDGRLAYAAYNPEGDRLPDFSHCGYRGGGVALPHAPVRLYNLMHYGHSDGLAAMILAGTVAPLFLVAGVLAAMRLAHR